MAWRDVDSGPPPELPEFFKFAAIGDNFAGKFISYSSKPDEYEGRKYTKHDYTFEAISGIGAGIAAIPGKLYTISAHAHLHQGLERAIKDGLIPGHLVAAKYTGNLTKPDGTATNMKLFKVRIDMEPGAKKSAAPPAPKPPPPPPPADDDVPF